MLSDTKVHVRLKLSGLWAAVMFCYIYGDLFGFFQQKTLAEIIAGTSGPIGTQVGLLAAAAVMAVPSVMVFLCLALGATLIRLANIVLGLAFTAFVIATVPGAWMFYKLLSAVEVILTLTIVWNAYNWPRQCAPRDPVTD